MSKEQEILYFCTPQEFKRHCKEQNTDKPVMFGMKCVPVPLISKEPKK